MIVSLTPTASISGTVVPAGPIGPRGFSVLSGTGAPTAATGTDNDFYVDLATARFYGPKASGAWPATYTPIMGQTPWGTPADWQANVAYTAQSATQSASLVRYNDGLGMTTYVCLAAHTSGNSFDVTKWRKLVDAASLQGGTITGATVFQQSPTGPTPAVGDNSTNMATTAYFDREFAWTAVGDTNYTLLTTDRVVVLTAGLTASRTWTLPRANSMPAGHRVRFIDVAGGVSSTATMTHQRSGTDTINGGTTFVTSHPYASIDYVTDGVSKWSVDVVGIARGGTGATTVAGAQAKLGLGTAATQSVGTSPGNVVQLDLVTGKLPAVDGSALLNSPHMSRQGKTASYTLVSTDAGSFLDFTGSGGYTLTISPATLGAGNIILFRNSTSGVVTLTASSGVWNSGSLTSIAAYPNESFIVVSDGTNLEAIGRHRGWITLVPQTAYSAVASINITTGFSDSEIQAVHLRYFAIQVATSGQAAIARLQKSGSYQSSGYLEDYLSAGTPTQNTSATQMDISCGIGLTTNRLNGELEIHNIQDTSSGSNQMGRWTGMVTGTPTILSGAAYQSMAAAITGVQILAASGNVSGTVTVLGLRP